MSENVNRLTYANWPLDASNDDLSLGLAALTQTVASGVVATLTVPSTAAFLQTHRFWVQLGLRDGTTTILSNREDFCVAVFDATTLTVISRTDSSRTHAVGEIIAPTTTADDQINNPGPLTTTGSMPYLAASGNMAELMAGADRTFVVYSSGLPIARAIQAADIPDLSASYATPGSVISYVSGAYVPLTRTVNGHALSANVTVSASDVGLGSVENAAASGLYVPLTRTVNGHALSANVSVTASDLSLGNVENTALSTWAGSTNLTTLGTIATGAWGGTAIAVNKGGTGQASAGIAAFNAITGYTAAGATGTTSTNLVFSTSPTLTTPILGTPTSGTLTNCTGLPEGGLSLTDITTNDVSATKHGFAPKYPNNTTTFLRGDGTYAAPASSGVTNIATTSPISGGPITSTGTIALLVNVDFAWTVPQSMTNAGIAATSTDGLTIANTTPATSGVAVQQSPRLRFRSQVWNTTATAATNSNDFFIESVPVSAATPSGLLKFGSSLNGAAATYPMTLSSVGTLTAAGQFLPAVGTASLPSFAFSGTGNFGFYAVATNQIGISSAGNLPIVLNLASSPSGLGLSQAGAIQWTSGNSGSPTFDTYDLILKRGGAAATLQLGVDVNGAAVSQIVQGPNGITGTDKTGGNLTLRPGVGTGAGAVSSLIFQTPTVGSTGTTAQVQATRLTLTSTTLTFAEALDCVLGTTTGTKWGTAASQKQSFWNATPIVQPTTAIAAATFAANTSLIANDTATFDGYTIGQVVKALRNTGLLA